MTETPTFDLDKARAERREARGAAPTITVGGTVYDLPVEFPLATLNPLLELNIDLGTIGTVLVGATNGTYDSNAEVAGIVLGLLGADDETDGLPEVIDAVKGVIRTITGDELYQALADAGLTVHDLGELGGYVAKVYGVNLGESSASTDSAPATGGGTSEPTSSGSTESTSETSSAPPETKD